MNIHAEQIGDEVRTVEFEPMPREAPKKAPVEPEREDPVPEREPAPKRKEAVPA